MGFHLIAVFLIAIRIYVADADNPDEEAKEKLLEFYNSQIVDICRRQGLATWNYRTNITPENEQLMIDVNLQKTKFEVEFATNFSRYDRRNFTNFSRYDQRNSTNFSRYDQRNSTNEITHDQLEILSKEETNGSSDNDQPTHIATHQSLMIKIYSTTKICKFNDTTSCNLNFTPEITKLMSKSHNYDERLDAWNQWHTKVGRAIKPHYAKFARLKIVDNKYQESEDRIGNMSRDDYFLKDIKPLWIQIKPFYLQLHAYMRNKLMNIYGEANMSSTGPIPAHLLGNMWAFDWSTNYNLTRPFQLLDESDVTSKMKEQNYTVNRMFRMAEDFFISIGMEPMNEEFWNNSMFEKPNDGREVDCHPSAFDMCDGNDFRIKMCTNVNYGDLITVHHEMGHIQYYQQYRHHPLKYRRGASPGFHEAVGDAVALSVSSIKHLTKFNLSEFNHETAEYDINFLYQMALRNVGFLPFSYMADYWRWKVLHGYIPESKWNEEWWNLKKEYQGIEPAVERSTDDFDPASRFHITADISHHKYFESRILQFQFHKALCELAGEYNSSDPTKPLHHCDIYNSTEAGEKFSKMMKFGSSKPWPGVLQMFVGQDKLDASPFIEYFQPLIDFLVKDNEENGVKIGWE